MKRSTGEPFEVNLSGQESANSSAIMPSEGQFSKLEHKLHALMGAASYSTNPSTERTLKQKLENLCYQERVSFETNILDYWRKLHNQDQELGKLVQTALAVPSTQVSVERAFSALSTIITKQWSKLGKDTINNILLVKLNAHLLNQVCLE